MGRTPGTGWRVGEGGVWGRLAGTLSKMLLGAVIVVVVVASMLLYQSAQATLDPAGATRDRNRADRVDQDSAASDPPAGRRVAEADCPLQRAFSEDF